MAHARIDWASSICVIISARLRSLNRQPIHWRDNSRPVMVRVRVVYERPLFPSLRFYICRVLSVGLTAWTVHNKIIERHRVENIAKHRATMAAGQLLGSSEIANQEMFPGFDN